MTGRLLWLCSLLALSSSLRAEVSLELRHLWKGRVFSIPSGAIVTASGETIELSRLSYLLSSPRLLGRRDPATSPAWLRRNDWFAYVDASGPEPVTRLQLGKLPHRNYSILQLQLGLDEATDEADPGQYPPDHPLNPNLNNLHWTPQGGYIFLAIEGHLRKSGDTGGFAYHLGNSWNRTTLNLPLSLDLTGSAVISIDVHLDRLFNGNKPLQVEANPSTHSRKDDVIAVMLKKRLPSAFEVRGIRQTQSTPLPRSSSSPAPLVGSPYRFRVARGFPLPNLPTSPPLTNERVALGKRLFHDPLLSRTNKQSCSSCHQMEHALSDPRRFSEGATGELGTRNSMPLFNLAWKSSFFWDGSSPSLREQVLHPIQSAIEMHESLPDLFAELEAANYGPLFQSAFGSAGITEKRLGIALEQFLLTLTSYDSRFDRAARGETELTTVEKRGFELFMTEYDPRRGLKGADCFHCHGGALFTNHRFHNNGLPDGRDHGLELVTGRTTDRNRFITPSLRNIALTAPYMHDGRFQTLEEVVEHYDSGLHHSPTLDPNLAKHPREGLGLDEKEKTALVAFLRTLTDPQFLPRPEAVK
jgi:cytochrome c peroxidase